MTPDPSGNLSASLTQPPPLASPTGNVQQTVTQSGEANVSIGNGQDVQIGHRYYLNAADMGALLQAYGSHLPPVAPTPAAIPTDDPGELPTLTFEAALANRINARLSTLEELHKAGQLAESQATVFNQVKHKVRSMMQLQQDLENLEADADRLLQAAILDLTNKLKALEYSQTETYLEIRSQACLQEQIDRLKQFQTDLEDGKVVAYWLNTARSADLVITLRQHAFTVHPHIEAAATLKQIEGFDFSIGLLLENLAHCLNWGRQNILQDPKIPKFLADPAYITAFEQLKTQIPDHLPRNGVDQLLAYTDELIKRLPTYEYKSIT